MNSLPLPFPPGGRRRWLLPIVLGFLLSGFAAVASAATLKVVTTALPAAVGGVPYAQTLAATGGTAPYTWAIQSGGLPPGLTLNAATGVISGTPSAASWAYAYPFSVYVKVTDAAKAIANANLALPETAPTAAGTTSSAGTSGSSDSSATTSGNSSANTTTTTTTTSSPLKITTTSLPAATGGVAYTQTLAATGGTTPYTWAIQSGGLPPGLTLNAATGVISGTPTAATWIYSYPFSIYLKLTDATGKVVNAGLTITVNAPAGGSTDGSGSGGTGGSGGGTTTPPPPSTYTVTVTGGTANGVASGTFAPGVTVTLVAGAAPAGQYFKQWTGGAPVANAFASTTSFTMPSSNLTVAATFYTPAPVPQPVTGHPRLWINASDVAALRARATPSNSVYQSLRQVLATCANNYTTKFYPGGQPNPSNPDFGDTQGYTGLITEQNALVFALFSLIDPDPTARIQHAQRARNIIMLAMNEAVKGHAAGQPFRDPMFALFNRANANSECWPLAIDWIYDAVDANNQPILTAADKKTIRDVFLIWANDCLNAYISGGDHPSPLGVTNSTSLLPGGNAYRIAANNYYAGHARLLTLMSLCVDPADDPAVDPHAPAAVLGNSLRSYLPNATGAWLYQQFAMYGDPADVRAAFNLPATANVGLASGGLSPEGGLYGHSYSYLLGELLALKTAGFADPTLSGPQAALATAPVWDRYLAGFANSIEPLAKVPPSQSYLGPVFRMANYGDVLRLWITPDFMQVFALKNLLDQKNGVTTNLDATRWFAVNAVEGGAAGLTQRITQPWSYGVQDAVLYFLLLDPALPTPADPRPAYASHFYDAGNGRLLARTDWSANASIFTFRSSWESINHQNGDAGQFELFRKGEWLTKELSNYDNNGNGQSSMWHNSLALQNWCANGTPNLNFFEAAYWPNGSQWNNGQSAGDPVTLASTGAGYAYAQTDMTKLYNRPSQWTPANAANDIAHASRSVLWLHDDHIVVYDRATSLHTGLFKRFNLTLTAAPAIDAASRTVTVHTPGGQHLFVQSLLPANATMTFVPLDGSVTNVAELEPSVGRLVVEDPSRPTDVRFLHVLQGTDGSVAAADPTALVHNTTGTPYDGAVVLDTVVLFRRDLATGFSSLGYTVPATTEHHYVTGLTPGAGYTVTASSDGTTAQVSVTPGGPLTADAAGVLVFDLANVLP